MEAVSRCIDDWDHGSLHDRDLPHEAESHPGAVRTYPKRQRQQLVLAELAKRNAIVAEPVLEYNALRK